MVFSPLRPAQAGGAILFEGEASLTPGSMPLIPRSIRFRLPKKMDILVSKNGKVRATLSAFPPMGGGV
jgi:hypothetical protein